MLFIDLNATNNKRKDQESSASDQEEKKEEKKKTVQWHVQVWAQHQARQTHCTATTDVESNFLTN